jgi:hypothetical protein
MNKGIVTKEIKDAQVKDNFRHFNGGNPMMNQRKRISFVMLFVFMVAFPVCSFAAHLHPETWYVG